MEEKEFFNKISKMGKEIDNKSKSMIFPMYDIDTNQKTFNFYPSEELKIRIINGKKIFFTEKFAYTEIIYSTDNFNYTYTYAYVYNKKLVALGEEQGRYGGITYILTEEKDAKQIVEKLGKSDFNDDKLLYEKVKGMEIATLEEMPLCPKTMYRITDFKNYYYINNNKDKTFTLWCVNKFQDDKKELITGNLNIVKNKLINEINKNFFKY